VRLVIDTPAQVPRYVIRGAIGLLLMNATLFFNFLNIYLGGSTYLCLGHLLGPNGLGSGRRGRKRQNESKISVEMDKAKPC
jgi:hypothetical protein